MASLQARSSTQGLVHGSGPLRMLGLGLCARPSHGPAPRADPMIQGAMSSSPWGSSQMQKFGGRRAGVALGAVMLPEPQQLTLTPLLCYQISRPVVSPAG